MPISSSTELDELVWNRATDQFGDINSDRTTAGYIAEDILVKTINGVTYVVGTFQNGDIQLHKYTDDDGDGTYSFTKLGHYQGGSGAGDGYATTGGNPYTSPTLEQVGDTLIITADTEQDHTAGFTFDLNIVPASYDANTQGIEFHQEFISNQSTGNGSTNEELQSFDVGGKTYYLHIGTNGDMRAFTVEYDEATDQLTYVENQDVDSAQFSGDKPFLGSRLARSDTLDGNDTNILATGILDTDFIQKDDGTILSYSTGVYGLHVAKWEVDPDTGLMTAAQVVYTDGTTTKDLHDAGYTGVADYPAESPFTPGAISLADVAENGPWGSSNVNWLQEIAQVAQGPDAPDGSFDVIDLQYLRNVETFQIGSQQYLFVNTWSGSENGSAVFSVNSDTGLPDQLLGFVEVDTGTLDGDDAGGISVQNFTDIVVSVVTATGEHVITVGAGNGYMQFKFDPSATPSAANGAGVLTYIGNDTYANQNNGFLPDTSPNGSAMTTGGAISQFEILPDGQVIGNDGSGYWISDAGLSPICFASGTLILTDRGEVPVQDLKQGDLVQTKANGLKPIQWIGQNTYRFGPKSCSAQLRPIRISAGALGEGLPRTDLYISPQHRVLVKSKIAQRMCGFDEVLVAVKQLLNIEGIDVVEDCDEVTYVHFLFDQHEVVYSNGAETESLFTGPEALKSVAPCARKEILALFPELAELDYQSVSSRFAPSGRMARQLAHRHAKNNRPLYTELLR